jgi:DNA-binding NtrC family response regulator
MNDQPRRILVAEDDRFLRKAAEMALKRRGYTVLTAANGREALDVYKEQGNEISLVILDLVMPEMGGKQCFQELVKINARVRLLVASGYTYGGTLEDVSELGASGFVSKPYDMTQLLQSVRTVLDAP